MHPVCSKRKCQFEKQALTQIYRYLFIKRERKMVSSPFIQFNFLVFPFFILARHISRSPKDILDI